MCKRRSRSPLVIKLHEISPGFICNIAQGVGETNFSEVGATWNRCPIEEIKYARRVD